MYPIHLISARLAARLRLLLESHDSDRGDSPVPTAVIIAGLVVLAVAVVAWIYVVGQGYMDQAPTELPPGPGGG